MANYKFQNVNHGVAISNPTIVVCNIDDNRNGTATIWVLITQFESNPSKEVVFKIALSKEVFTYTGDQPMKIDVDAWAEAQILTYIVP